MKTIILVLLLLPGMVLAQSVKEDYNIYSRYLQEYRASKRNKKMHFVVRESFEYLRKYDTTALSDIVIALRNYVKGDPGAKGNVIFQFQAFADTLRNDTLWLPLIAELNEKTKHKFALENAFSKKLDALVISNKDYNAYFTMKDWRTAWAAFYAHYPKNAVLTELSEIVSDGKRAVFYFTVRYGALGGEGYLVFCYKENSIWKFIPTHPLWQA